MPTLYIYKHSAIVIHFMYTRGVTNNKSSSIRANYWMPVQQ